MAAIDFPTNPGIGQTFTSGLTTWSWDGIKWNLVPNVVQGPMGTGNAVIYAQMYV